MSNENLKTINVWKMFTKSSVLVDARRLGPISFFKKPITLQNSNIESEQKISILTGFIFC